jgi:hypothetical protein
MAYRESNESFGIKKVPVFIGVALWATEGASKRVE